MCEIEKQGEKRIKSKSITDSDLVLAGEEVEQREPFMWLLSH